jgi:iron-sulfur cluster repair protein YtfE (RIC family)
MIPSDARRMLLAQHARIRELLESVQALAAALARGEPVALQLEVGLEDLRRSVGEHNRAEQAILEPILRMDAAWGPLRVERMIEEHAAEHAAFEDALVGTDQEVAARLADLAEDIDAHMMAEERIFLSAGVLRDDVVNVEDGD